VVVVETCPHGHIHHNHALTPSPLVRALPRIRPCPGSRNHSTGSVLQCNWRQAVDKLLWMAAFNGHLHVVWCYLRSHVHACEVGRCVRVELEGPINDTRHVGLWSARSAVSLSVVGVVPNSSFASDREVRALVPFPTCVVTISQCVEPHEQQCRRAHHCKHWEPHWTQVLVGLLESFLCLGPPLSYPHWPQSTHLTIQHNIWDVTVGMAVPRQPAVSERACVPVFSGLSVVCVAIPSNSRGL
jgi:hypothetical protein